MDAVKEINEKVDHEEKCPNEGDSWGCCCKCVNQVKLHVCACNKCPAVIDGYVCIGAGMTDEGSKDVVTGAYSHRKHGQCELFDERDKYELKIGKKNKEE